MFNNYRKSLKMKGNDFEIVGMYVGKSLLPSVFVVVWPSCTIYFSMGLYAMSVNVIMIVLARN
jgi:hypothetical protein